MVVSQEWEKIHSTKDWGRYPNEYVVAFAMRTFSESQGRSDITVLDLGFGGGGNLKFFCEQGFSAYGIEGSPSALNKTTEFLSLLGHNPNLVLGSMTDLSSFPDRQFNLVIDVRSMSNIPRSKIHQCVSEVERVLDTGGYFLSLLYGKGCMSVEHGRQIEAGTFVDVPDGPCAGIGAVSIFDVRDVRRLFVDFTILKHHRIKEEDVGGNWSFEDHLVICQKT